MRDSVRGGEGGEEGGCHKTHFESLPLATYQKEFTFSVLKGIQYCDKIEELNLNLKNSDSPVK